MSASNSLCYDLVLLALILFFCLNVQAIIEGMLKNAAPCLILYICGTAGKYKSLKAIEALIEEHWKEDVADLIFFLKFSEPIDKI